jgi:predicted phage gp36 major capsid-like protein
MSKLTPAEETANEIERNRFVEEYIKELKWHDSTSDEVRTYVCGNLRGLWSCVEASNAELRKRYGEARSLVKRLTDGYYREGTEDTETIDEAMSDALDWISHEELEDEVFHSKKKES